MNAASVQRYLRQIALSEIGPSGQERLAGATVVVAAGAAGDLIAEVAARYLAAAGVGTLRLAGGAGDDPADAALESALRGSNPDVVLARAPWPDGGTAWLALLAGAGLVLRSGFEDDAMLRAAIRLGVPAVIARGDGQKAELISFRRHGPCPHAALDVARSAPMPLAPSAAAVVAGTLAAAEAIHALLGQGQDAGEARARHLSVPLDGGAPLAQEIPWAPECFACGGGATEMEFQ